MSDKPKSAGPAPCSRCEGSLDLLTHLPGMGDHPAYRIFKCAVCGFVEWIAQPAAK